MVEVVDGLYAGGTKCGWSESAEKRGRRTINERQGGK